MLVDFLLNAKTFATSSAERTGAALAGLAILDLTLLLAAGTLGVFVVFAVVVVFVLLVVVMMDVPLSSST
jgi:uncharacterized membrane protein